MADLIIRNVGPETIKRLKLRAKQHHRSLQSELKYILESTTKMSIKEAKKLSRAWHRRLSDHSFSDSTKLLRKERDR